MIAFGRKLKLLKKMWPLIPAALYLIGFLVIVSLFLLGLSLSVTSRGQTTFPALQTYQAIFSDSEFWVALVNSTIFVIIGTPLELLTGLILAVILYKRFIMRNAVRSLLLIPLAIPALVTAILLLILFDYPGGHINHLLMGNYSLLPGVIQHPVNWRGSTLFALGVSMLGKIWRDMPISMLIIIAGLNAIDPLLFDAARTMGAGWRKQLTSVIIPLILPSISAVLLLRSIEMWKEFIFPFVLAGRFNLLGTLIELFYNDWSNPHKAAAVAVVLVVCISLTAVVLFVLTELTRRLLTGR
ncbi:MAG: ABC transporter permease subunit [Chitinivibrionales bacterium]|nr:ABC transporter permease subunit [Chitinivibrionales bacterium]